MDDSEADVAAAATAILIGKMMYELRDAGGYACVRAREEDDGSVRYFGTHSRDTTNVSRMKWIEIFP